ncbi:MAG: hypothetical protein AABW82_02775 [Nanoarchaeota archaeon]
MINKTLSHAYETRYNGIKSGVITPFGSALIQTKINLLKKGHIFPDTLISEMENYAERNILIDDSVMNEASPMHKCCPNCLKAHTLVKASELGVEEETIESLSSSFKGEIGHNGYYLDEDELIKLSNY